MLENDMAEVLSHLKNHFPKATDGDGPLLWDQIKGYGLVDTKRAIEKHRLECGKIVVRPDINRVRVLAATHFRERQPRGGRQTIWEACCRRNFPGINRVSDLIQHFAFAWQKVRDGEPDEHGKVADDKGRAGARSVIFNSARMAFRQEGVPDAEADRTAREVVDLGPNESPAMPSASVSDSWGDMRTPDTSGGKARALAFLNAAPVGPRAEVAVSSTIASEFDV